MRDGSGSEVDKRGRLKKAKRETANDARCGGNRLAHMNREDGYMAKYLDKLLVGSRNLVLRGRSVGSEYLKLRLLRNFKCDGGRKLGI